ncbi:DNA-3-methyladenine glycosylase II [Rhizobium aquaticum]|uniref:DNA-3-methyladenine glycosylase II n=1 Tax=Rhizobium aquaticum TaxID=1549636 RepID=A0ABV2J595_9HYPH
MKPITSEFDIAAGLDALLTLDPRLGDIVARAGPVPLRLQPAGFAGLAEIIVSQMVSKASASAIFGRLAAKLSGEVCGAGVIALGADGLFGVGLSRAKASALLAIAEAEIAGRLDLQGACCMETAEALAHLTAVKGVGPWTAEVYLMFCAGHPDIFPVGDIALVHAVHHAFGRDEKLKGRDLAALAECWSPWRSVAARLFWAFYSQALRRAADPLG